MRRSSSPVWRRCSSLAGSWESCRRLIVCPRLGSACRRFMFGRCRATSRLSSCSNRPSSLLSSLFPGYSPIAWTSRRIQCHHRLRAGVSAFFDWECWRISWFLGTFMDYPDSSPSKGIVSCVFSLGLRNTECLPVLCPHWLNNKKRTSFGIQFRCEGN